MQQKCEIDTICMSFYFVLTAGCTNTVIANNPIHLSVKRSENFAIIMIETCASNAQRVEYPPFASFLFDFFSFRN